MAFVKRGVGSIIPEDKDAQGNWDSEDQSELDRENREADQGTEEGTEDEDQK